MLQAKEHTPIPSPSIIFNFGFIVESIEELGGALVDYNFNTTKWIFYWLFIHRNWSTLSYNHPIKNLYEMKITHF